MKYKDDKATFDYAETLAEPIQHFTDALERELIQACCLKENKMIR